MLSHSKVKTCLRLRYPINIGPPSEIEQALFILTLESSQLGQHSRESMMIQMNKSRFGVLKRHQGVLSMTYFLIKIIC